jgi:hypothetical protein
LHISIGLFENGTDWQERYVDHHDKAYAAAYEIAKALTDDEGLLTTLAKVGVAPEGLAAFVESIGR